MLALIGGTGFDRPGIIEDPEEIDMETPYGRPSAPLIFGRLGSRPIVFLRRHGVHHEYAPHRVPYRANIWALQRAGVEGIIGVATVGGIGEALLPGDLMVPDQLIDYTWGRECTYYDSPDAGVKHIDFTMPFDQALSALLISAPAVWEKPSWPTAFMPALRDRALKPLRKSPAMRVTAPMSSA